MGLRERHLPQLQGQTGAKVVMNSFGASAPLAKLQEKFGFTLENVVKQAKAQIQLTQH